MYSNSNQRLDDFLKKIKPRPSLEGLASPSFRVARKCPHTPTQVDNSNPQAKLSC